MKKIIALAAILLSTAALGFGQTQEEVNAGKMIEFTNSVIDISNAYNTKYKSYTSYIERCEEARERYSANYDPARGSAIVWGGPHEILSTFFSKYDKTLAEVPAGMEGRDEIVAAVDEARAATKALDESCEEMNEYFAESKFVQDDWVGFANIHADMVFRLDEMQRMWRNAVGKAGEAGESAEALLLADSPMAQFVIPMKTDLNALSSLIGDIFDMDEDDYDYGPYIERNNALRESIEKNRDLDGKDTSILSSRSNYTSFYTHMDNVTQALANFMEELMKDEPNYNRVNSYVNNINTYYDLVISRYNNF